MSAVRRGGVDRRRRARFLGALAACFVSCLAFAVCPAVLAQDLATLDIIESEGLANADAMGARLRSGLERVAANVEAVRDMVQFDAAFPSPQARTNSSNQSPSSRVAVRTPAS